MCRVGKGARHSTVDAVYHFWAARHCDDESPALRRERQIGADSSHVKLEEVLLTWFGKVTVAGVNVDGKVLCEKANNIALSRKESGSVSCQRLAEHAAGGDFELHPRDVFNADESTRCIALLAMSWDNATSDTIATCFRKCGFKTEPDAAPTGDSEETNEDFGTEGWGSLQTQPSIHDFVIADDNFATCGLRSIEELVDEVNEVESDDDVCDQRPSTSESLNVLDVPRRTFEDLMTKVRIQLLFRILTKTDAAKEIEWKDMAERIEELEKKLQKKEDEKEFARLLEEERQRSRRFTDALLNEIAVPGDVTKPWFEGSDAGSRLMDMLVSFLSLLILDPMIADGVTKAGELAASVDTSKA
ncbi:hypothetical protein HPB49_026062 [Dermacentor silvarum]|nr:hypothetical protein HPB49_026062 [Dermacentor silvarum]